MQSHLLWEQLRAVIERHWIRCALYRELDKHITDFFSDVSFSMKLFIFSELVFLRAFTWFMLYHFFARSVNGLKIRWPPISIITRIFFSRWSLSIRTFINKIVAFGVMIIQKSLLKCHYIPKKSVFDVFYGKRETLVHISSKMRPAIMLQSMENWL